MATKNLPRWVRPGLFFLSSSSHTVQKPQWHPHNCMQSPARSIRPSKYSPCPSLSALSNSSSASSANEDEFTGEAWPKEEISLSEESLTRPHQLSRSHSCSKLQGRRVPSFIKSLLYRTSSHSRHSQTCNRAELEAVGVRSTEAASSAGLSKYTRSWSSPSLHLRQRMIKIPERARSISLVCSRTESSIRGKRAPRGHVVVYVEAGRERRVVPIAHLSHPHFQALLERAHNEFGFRQKGGLLIPCSLSELQHTLGRIHVDSITS